MNAARNPETVGIPELAKLLGLRPNVLHYWLQRCDLKLHRMGNRLFAYDNEVDDILAKIRAARETSADQTPGGISLTEAAKRAGIEYRTAQTLVRIGRFTATTVGRRVVVDPESVDRYVRARAGVQP